MNSPSPAIDRPASRLEAGHRQQQWYAAMAIVMAIVLETAALLSGGLYLLASGAGWDTLRWTAAVGFWGFSVAAFGTVGGLVLLGNTRAQRRLRRIARKRAQRRERSRAPA